jgi:hypothetical protein
VKALVSTALATTDELPVGEIGDALVEDLLGLLEAVAERSRGLGRLQGRLSAYTTVMGFGDTIRRTDVRELYEEVAEIVRVMES